VDTTITDKEALRAVYKSPNPRSVAKELKRLDPHCLRFVALSPFAVLGTCGEAGADVSPRGGPPGFIKALDSATLIVPDFPGNNRLDSLENILENGKVGLIFLVPGVDETLRVNGHAVIDTDPKLLALGEMDGRLPRTVIKVAVDAAYLHCAKALMRSALWDPTAQIERTTLPSMGQMLKDQVNWETAETQEEMVERYKETLY
jgi:PPOX class probable FMN-dependent enzyme